MNTTSTQSQSTGVRIDSQQKAALDSLAAQYQTSTGAIIRLAIANLLTAVSITGTLPAPASAKQPAKK